MTRTHLSSVVRFLSHSYSRLFRLRWLRPRIQKVSVKSFNSRRCWTIPEFLYVGLAVTSADENFFHAYFVQTGDIYFRREKYHWVDKYKFKNTFRKMNKLNWSDTAPPRVKKKTWTNLKIAVVICLLVSNAIQISRIGKQSSENVSNRYASQAPSRERFKKRNLSSPSIRCFSCPEPPIRSFTQVSSFKWFRFISIRRQISTLLLMNAWTRNWVFFYYTPGGS